MHKLPFDITWLHQNTPIDSASFILRYNDLNDQKQRAFITIITNEQSTMRKRVRKMEPERIHEALNYLNPLLVYNDSMYEGTPTLYHNKTVKTGKMRTIGQMIDTITRRRHPEEWEMNLIVHELPTMSRKKQLRNSPEWQTMGTMVRNQCRPNATTQQANLNTIRANDFVNSFNITL